jgi:uncharacterized protein with von Willebrand factor type A (vWA) domain
MEQETQTTGETDERGAETGSQKLERDLRAEIQRLSASFLEVMRVAWQSDQRKQLERDLKTGLNSVAANLEDGFKKVSESQEAKEFLNRAEDVADSVAEKVRKSEVAQDLGEGLLKGLRSLSEQIDHLATDLKRKEQTSASGATNQGDAGQAQDIPIDKA